MATMPEQQRKQASPGRESTWELKVLLTIISVGVLALVLKTVGIL